MSSYDAFLSYIRTPALRTELLRLGTSTGDVWFEDDAITFPTDRDYLDEYLTKRTVEGYRLAWPLHELREPAS